MGAGRSETSKESRTLELALSKMSGNAAFFFFFFFKFAWYFLETASSLAWLEGMIRDMIRDMEWQTTCGRGYIGSVRCE